MKHIILCFLVVFCVNGFATDAKPTLKPLTLSNHLAAQNYGDIFFSGQPTEAQLKELRKQGFATVISLRSTSESEGYNEAQTAKSNGLDFVRIPISNPKEMTPEKVDEITKAVSGGKSKGRVLVHCASGGRVGLWAGAHFKKDHGYSEEQAMKVAKGIGMPSRFQQQWKTLMTSQKASK